MWPRLIHALQYSPLSVVTLQQKQSKIISEVCTICCIWQRGIFCSHRIQQSKKSPPPPVQVLVGIVNAASKCLFFFRSFLFIFKNGRFYSFPETIRDFITKRLYEDIGCDGVPGWRLRGHLWSFWLPELLTAGL